MKICYSSLLIVFIILSVVYTSGHWSGGEDFDQNSSGQRSKLKTAQFIFHIHKYLTPKILLIPNYLFTQVTSHFNTQPCFIFVIMATKVNFVSLYFGTDQKDKSLQFDLNKTVMRNCKREVLNYT